MLVVIRISHSPFTRLLIKYILMKNIYAKDYNFIKNVWVALENMQVVMCSVHPQN